MTQLKVAFWWSQMMAFCRASHKDETSVTRLGFFRKVSLTSCLTKVAQIFEKLLCLFWKTALLKFKLMWLHFGQLLKTIGQLFIPTSGHTGMLCAVYSIKGYFVDTIEAIKLGIRELCCVKLFWMCRRRCYISFSLEKNWFLLWHDLIWILFYHFVTSSGRYYISKEAADSQSYTIKNDSDLREREKMRLAFYVSGYNCC